MCVCASLCCASRTVAAEEVERLRLTTETAQEEIDALREAVDAGAAYEEMIETLTDRNLELSNRVDELEGALRDLEQEQELSEELDAGQRQGKVMRPAASLTFLSFSLSLSLSPPLSVSLSVPLFLLPATQIRSPKMM